MLPESVEAIASVLAVKNDIVPPTINHAEGDNDENIDYELNFTFNKAQKTYRKCCVEQYFRFWWSQCMCNREKIR